MMLCASSPMVPGATLSEQAEHLRAWGYDGIAVFQPLDAWTPEVRRELVSLESRTGVRPVEFVLSGAAYGHAFSTNPELRQRCRAMYREAVEVCAEIGAVTEIEWEYGPQDPLPLFEPFRQLNDRQKREFVAFYSGLLDLVADTPGRVLLEPINRYESGYLNRVTDNLELIDAVSHPNAGLLPDTFHMSIEEASISASLRLAGARVAHVHLGDNNRLLPGSGRLDWMAIFGALRDIGYDGAVNLECSTEGDPAQSLPRVALMLRDLARA